MRMRKKRRCAERMTALSALFTDADNFSQDVFSENLPLRMEIGCGKGDFICALSKKEPQYNYIAVEKVEDVAVVAAEKYARTRGLGDLDGHGAWKAPDGSVYNGVRWEIPAEMRGNVRFMRCDASHISEYFPEGSFDAIYANFSDPWPKKGYQNRRLTHPDFLKQYIYLLKSGGKFVFKTDNRDLFDFSLESLQGESAFEITFVSRDLHKSERAAENIMTEYERNFSEKGVPINCVEARKK